MTAHKNTRHHVCTVDAARIRAATGRNTAIKEKAAVLCDLLNRPQGNRQPAAAGVMAKGRPDHTQGPWQPGGETQGRAYLIDSLSKEPHTQFFNSLLQICCRIRKREVTQTEPQIIRVWRAPAGRAARYCTVTEAGDLVRYFESLAEIRKHYKHSIDCGAAVLKRELQNTYKPRTPAELLQGKTKGKGKSN